MKLLSKSTGATWWNGKPKPGRSNLDHVVAASHMKFTKFGGAEVDVRGWPEKETPNQQRTWINRHSDHAFLYFEILTT